VTSTYTRLPLSTSRLRRFCRKYHIRKLAFFGSVLRDDFRPTSDVDVLVEFETEYNPGLEFFLIELELSHILRRKVDLNTPNFLEPEIRHRVIAEAVVQYEQS